VRDRFKFEQERQSVLNAIIRPRYDKAFVVASMPRLKSRRFHDNTEVFRWVRMLRRRRTAMYDALLRVP